MNEVRRGKGARTTVPAKDGRAGICWTVTSPHRHPTSLGRGLHLLQDLGRFVHVAFVVDVFAQGIAGWHAATSQGHRPGPDTSADRVVGPGPVKGSRSSLGQLLHHCRCREPVHIHPVHQHLALEGIAPSIGTVGDAYPNALMESIIGLFKTEAIATTVFHDGPYKTLADVEYATAGWVDWYNHRRLHGSLGWLSPVEYEQDYYAALSREPQPA